MVLPVFSKVILNMHSQSDVSQSCWIYWIYCVCLDWLDCPVDTLLPGNIVGNALQCTVHAPTHIRAAAWSPGTEYNCSAGGRQSQATFFCTEQTRTNLDTSIQWAQYTNTELQGQVAARKWAQDSRIILSNSRSWPERLLPACYSCTAKRKIGREYLDRRGILDRKTPRGERNFKYNFLLVI